MANPQLEKGYTKIANELLDALPRIQISGDDRRVFDYIIRQTYGFHRKKADISLNDFCLGTGLPKSRLCRAIIRLYDRKLIDKSVNKKSVSYNINKDFDEWKSLTNQSITKSVDKPVNSHRQTSQQLLTNQSTAIYRYKDNIKDNIKDNATVVAKPIPDLLKDKNAHIKIIGLFAKAKKMTFDNPLQVQNFIKRNLRAAQTLVGYDFQRIVTTMKWLIDNADFKWTIETVGKYIDEDLAKIKNKEDKNRVKLHDGGYAIKKFGKWVMEGHENVSIDTHYYPELNN